MAQLNISIEDVQMTPMLVNAGSQFVISVTISDMVFGLLTANEELLLTETDGRAIEYYNN